MTNKTALEMLIERLEILDTQFKGMRHYQNGYKNGVWKCIECAKDLLPTERTQIEEACLSGIRHVSKEHGELIIQDTYASDYFTKKYKDGE